MIVVVLDQLSLIDIFANQITTLSITGSHNYYDPYASSARAGFLSKILMIFRNVHHLKFHQNFNYYRSSVSFDNQSSLFSSTLRELHVDVYLFGDCLYLLDGRLNHLSTSIKSLCVQ